MNATKPENRIWNPACECLPREELEPLQLKRLKKVVKTAWDKVPYYRRKMEAAGVRPPDIRTLADVTRLPFTTKDDLRSCFPYRGFAVPMERIVRIHASSGTTGQATVVGYTRKDLETWAELMARLHTAAGITNSDIVQIAFGYGFFTGGIGHHYGIEKVGAAVLPVSSGKSERQIQIMKDYHSTVLICTPSYGLYLAEVADRMGARDALCLRLGLFGGEAWTEPMRQALQKGLGVFATDNYGLSEVMGPGVSCECIEQRGMHIAEDHFLPELIEPATGAPAPDPAGAGGELVLTTLTKEGIPVLRYRTRDLCTFLPGNCPCGRTGRRMSKVSARSDDMLIIRGVNVYPQQIEAALLAIEGVAPHYQIVVSRAGALDELEVLVEATEGIFFDQMWKQQEMKDKIERRLEVALGVHAKVRLVEPGSTPRSEGKAVRVLDKRV
ncbi:MAG: phenylacetate--CoA ligase [Kiritimatiellae bacterium]|nr:phenylacetate--CoA ligase [Kiritimatiellia bacterium]HQN79983.1 phenylacetate--CoA ligase [Kiritimatiellia bacterium]